MCLLESSVNSCSSPVLNLAKDRRSISSCRILRYDVWPDSSSILLICTVMLRARYQYSSNTDHFFWINARRAATSSTFVQLWLEWSYELQYTQGGLWFSLDLPLFPRSIFSLSLFHELFLWVWPGWFLEFSSILPEFPLSFKGFLSTYFRTFSTSSSNPPLLSVVVLLNKYFSNRSKLVH